MSNRLSVNIHIGGALPAVHSAELIDTICLQEVALGWNGRPFQPDSITDLWKALINGVIHLYDNHTSKDKFPDLEAFCQRVGLSYNRYYDGNAEWNPGMVAWRPGWETPREFVTDTDGKIVVHAEALEEVVDMWAAQGDEAALGYLRALAGLDLPPLPPFSINIGERTHEKAHE